MQTLSEKLSDKILEVTQDIFTTVLQDESEITEKINAMCFSIEYFSAFCASTVRKIAEKENDSEVSRITLDFMLEAILDKRAEDMGAKVSEVSGERSEDHSKTTQ